MQAIQTKYISATNLRGSRIKAWCCADSITVPYTYDKGEAETHLEAAYKLVEKLGWDDDHYGTLAQGALPNNAGYCHVFIKTTEKVESSYTLENFFMSIHDIYEQFDGDKISTKEAKYLARKCCAEFLIGK